jgi:hypothetical protein
MICMLACEVAELGYTRGCAVCPKRLQIVIVVSKARSTYVSAAVERMTFTDGNQRAAEGS